MKLPLRLRGWPSLAAAVAFACCLVVAAPTRVTGQGPVAKNDQQASEIEKQIEALKKKLDDLKKQPETPKETTAATDPNLPADWTKSFTWRSIGPANMGGRIVAMSVYENDPTTFWLGHASAGLLKTTNNGTTYTHQFDKEATASVGDVCVAPSDPNIVYVGTGEENPRNSASYGDGVYKSTDGGKTWTNVGLKKTFQIGRVIVHPKDPNTVYVGALGRLWGPNEERGLFKTTDGGKNWQKVLYVDEKTGVIDAAMHPTEPDTLLVATYERQRDIYCSNDPMKKWGPGAALWKTTDGGKTFNKLTKGLPTCNLGRIGIDYYRKDPNQVYVILESEKIGMGPARSQQGNGYVGIQGEDGDGGVKLTAVTEDGPAEKAGLRAGDLILSFGDKAVAKYDDLVELIRGKSANDKIKVKYTRDKDTKEIELTLGSRAQAAGAGQGLDVDPSRPFGAMLGGQRENVQEQQGPDSFQYGGIYKSTDGGESWTRINSLNPRPMYFSKIRVDPTDNNHLWVLGVSLHRSKDGGKTFTADGGRGTHADGHSMWINPRDSRHIIFGNDGGTYVTFDRGENWDHHNHVAIGQFYHVAIDPRRPSRVYGGLQDNGSWGGPTQTRSGGGLFGGGGMGPINEDWISIGGGDGFTCRVDPNDPDVIYGTSQGGAMFRRNLRTGEQGSIRPRPPQGQRYRFNWNSPFVLSNHNSKIFYAAGNYVFRSLDQGRDIATISPEITATDKGSATAISESPRNPNVLYVGTDDGYLWVTRDGGKEWTNVTKNVGLPGLFHVGSIEASRAAEGRAYACFTAHRSNDDNPHVYVTEDFGKTWKSITSNLPWGGTRCLQEDPTNHNLLYCGTEFAVFASLNRGQSWVKFNNNLPTVAVHEFAFHPTSGEMVAATHGRSLWVVDVTPLRQMTKDNLTAKAALYKPSATVRWSSDPARGRTLRRFVGENPQGGAWLYYSLAAKADKVSLKVLDYEGKTVREFTPSSEPGLHRYNWNLARTAQGQGRPTAPPGGQATEAGGRRGQGGPAAAQGTPAQGRGPGQGEGQPPGQPQGQGQGRGGGRGGPGGNFGQPVPPGMYRIVLTVDGQEHSQGLRVENDPSRPDTGIAEEMEEIEVDDEVRDRIDD